jgi:hypothetical protein
VILVFNWCGYQLLNVYLDNRVTEQLQTRLDVNDYDETDLISIKIPAEHLTYYNSSDHFVRVNGQLEIRGFLYSYVKRRLYNDSIELLCIPNQGAMQLTKARDDYYKLVNDLQNSGQDKKPDSHTSKNFAGEFYTIHELFRIANLPHGIQQKPDTYSENLSAGSVSRNEYPPQLPGDL